jgi:phage/plasmid-associated DNA primase
LAITWNPQAECRTFLGELVGSQLGAEDARLWQTWGGQGVLQKNLFQVFMIVMGTSGGGKGTRAKIINRLIGDENVYELRTQHLTSRFEMAFYRDKTLLFGPDAPPDFLSTDGAHMVKALTGGDRMSGEVKGSMKSVSIWGEYNMLVNCNSRMRAKLQGDAAAWARRMLIINFDNPPPASPIRGFAEHLIHTEGPGILNWFIEGARIVLQAARERLPFPMTEVQRERVTNLLSESDSVREFIKLRVRESHLPGTIDHITGEGMYKAYLAMCSNIGWTALPQRAFTSKADDILIAELRASKGNHFGEERNLRGWSGVVLTEEIPVDLYNGEAV